MKKGMILYVLGDKEDVKEEINLQETGTELGVDLVSLAFSESDIAYMWWQMITRGAQVVSCLHALYEKSMPTLVLQGVPIRLYG